MVLNEDSLVLHRLPWEWFDFLESPRKVAGLQGVPTVEEGGGKRVWGVENDGRMVPFKVLRRAGEPASPRPVLMLVHGMGLSIASFRGIAGYLLETHDLILPDYSSFTVKTFGEAGVGAAKVFAQSLWQIADALNVEKLDLGGNSLGGGLCLMATLAHKERIRRLVLSNPACFPQRLPRTYRLARWPLWGELMMAISGPEKFVGGIEYIGYVDKSRFEPELKERYLAHFARREMRLRLMNIMRHLPADARDLTSAPHLPHLAEITQPVLLTWGEQDPLLVPDAGDRLAAILPNVTYDKHADLAHMPHEEDPDRIGRRWVRWLRATHPRGGWLPHSTPASS